MNKKQWTPPVAVSPGIDLLCPSSAMAIGKIAISETRFQRIVERAGYYGLKTI